MGKHGFSITCFCALSSFIFWNASAEKVSHGFSYFGDLKYPKDMAHYDYVNPDAPKGGVARAAMVGTFNNLNPYVDKGSLPELVDPWRAPLTHEPLMSKSEDELAGYYGRLAESIEVADDFSWVTYTLRDNAYWHDGVPVTLDDVEWTFNALKTEASITWRMAYKDFERIEALGPRSFRIYFSKAAEKTPQLIIQSGRFYVLPKHYWQDRKFDETTIVPHLGNGPYRIVEVDIGNKIVLERVENYWGKDLNINVGKHNFDRYEFLFFFDKSVMLQALRAGVFDYYREQSEKEFATAYDFAGYREGLFKKVSYAMGYSYGMHYGIVLNTRRPPFDNIRVREALTLAYNFEWANRVFWHNGMDRNNSYFMRSGLQAKGLPSEAELELLKPFRDQIPARVFTHDVDLPRNNSFGRNRDALRRADEILRAEGWIIKDFMRVNLETGEELRIELLVESAFKERMLAPFVNNLERLGISGKIRRIERNIMVNRRRTYDYDAILRQYYTHQIPRSERMRDQFSSKNADPPNMTNYPGIKDPVVDFLVENILNATSENSMNIAGRALDRVLLWNFYLIPDGHPLARHLVYWDRFGHPPIGKEYMNWTGFPRLWWLDEQKNARVEVGLDSMFNE